jgi:hypothetical protein
MINLATLDVFPCLCLLTSGHLPQTRAEIASISHRPQALHSPSTCNTGTLRGPHNNTHYYPSFDNSTFFTLRARIGKRIWKRAFLTGLVDHAKRSIPDIWSLSQFRVRVHQCDRELFLARGMRRKPVPPGVLVLSVSSHCSRWDADNILGWRPMSERRHLRSIPFILLVHCCGGINGGSWGKIAMECRKRGNWRGVREWRYTGPKALTYVSSLIMTFVPKPVVMRVAPRLPSWPLHLHTQSTNCLSVPPRMYLPQNIHTFK